MTCHHCQGTGEVQVRCVSTNEWERDACTHCLAFDELVVRQNAPFTRCPGGDCEIKRNCKRYQAVKNGSRRGAIFSFAPFTSLESCRHFVGE